MNEVYVIYKNDKPYRTGSKSAVYLDKEKAIEIVLIHCKDDASKKWNKKTKYYDNAYQFKYLSESEKQGLIRKEFINYSVRIFKDTYDKVDFCKWYPKGEEPEASIKYNGWDAYKMDQVSECPSCHSKKVLGTPNDINGKIISRNICCNCGRVFEEEYLMSK